MEQFDLLLELCRLHCTEVHAASAVEASQFQKLTIVRGVTCSFKTPHLQELAVNSIDLTEILQSFTNSDAEKYNHQIPDTKLLTALMPKDNVNDSDTWFNSAINCPRLVHEPILLLATGNCFTGFHADSMLPTEVVAPLLRGRKLWIFASPRSKEAANLIKRPESSHLDTFIEDMVYHRHKKLRYCFHEPGDTVC